MKIIEMSLFFGSCNIINKYELSLCLFASDVQFAKPNDTYIKTAKGPVGVLFNGLWNISQQRYFDKVSLMYEEQKLVQAVLNFKKSVIIQGLKIKPLRKPVLTFFTDDELNVMNCVKASYVPNVDVLFEAAQVSLWKKTHFGSVML